ncbi:MAG TPA: hypothetical protein DIU37_03995 [Opitutae bacterium]|nr:hypothetical protein [Opitutae bacterium]
MPRGDGKLGRRVEINRRFLDAVLWILRTGALWHEMPPDLGDGRNTYCRFCRWRDRGVREALLEQVSNEPAP